LFVRSLLPHVGEARPKDRIQGGVAMRASEDELWLHPYLLREVCRNGAVMAQSVQSLHVEYLGMYTLDEGKEMLREAIARCAQEQVFTESIGRLRKAAYTQVDELLNLIPHLAPLKEAGMDEFVAQVLERFVSAGDRTQFGLMNAVTSLARDTREPEDRWRLEELGGGIGARLRPPSPSLTPGLAHYAVQELIGV
jgi:hypothetical protein